MRLMGPRKRWLHAWLWLLHIATGLGLCLYVVIHMIDVGTVLLGKDTYNSVAHLMEEGALSGVVWVVLLLVGVGLIIHTLNGFRIASRPYREPGRMWRHLRGVKHRGTWFWIFQVITGSLLVAFLVIHYFVIHGVGGGTITFEATQARLVNCWYFLLYGATLFVLLYHTVNGFRSVLIKLGIATELAAENRLLKIIYGVGALLFIIAVAVLIRFIAG
ncbi:hypothetical protein JW905_08165 [bacterium]|nr:hypothetical protein [candidate division CSSED10-310 bacterium]